MREIAQGIPLKIVIGSVLIGLASVLVSYLKKEMGMFDGWNGIEYMTPFCMFYLTFSNASAFGKWWKLRDLLGTVVSSHIDAACLLTAHLPLDEKMAEVSRLLKISMYTSLSFATGPGMTTEAYIRWISKAGELKKKEIELYTKIHKEYHEFGYAEASTAFFREATRLADKQTKFNSEHKIVMGTSLEKARSSLRCITDDFYVHFTQRFPIAYHNMMAIFMYPTIINIPFAVSSDDFLSAFVLGTFGGCFFYGTYVFRFVLFAPVVADKETKTLDQFDVADFARRGHRSIDRILRTEI